MSEEDTNMRNARKCMEMLVRALHHLTVNGAECNDQKFTDLTAKAGDYFLRIYCSGVSSHQNNTNNEETRKTPVKNELWAYPCQHIISRGVKSGEFCKKKSVKGASRCSSHGGKEGHRVSEEEYNQIMATIPETKSSSKSTTLFTKEPPKTENKKKKLFYTDDNDEDEDEEEQQLKTKKVPAKTINFARSKSPTDNKANKDDDEEILKPKRMTRVKKTQLLDSDNENV